MGFILFNTNYQVPILGHKKYKVIYDLIKHLTPKHLTLSLGTIMFKSESDIDLLWFNLMYLFSYHSESRLIWDCKFLEAIVRSYCV